jgi:two-component system NtrC family response regulator
MILIIDDDASIRSSLSFLLKRAGFEVNAVSEPKEALDAVRILAPELILMDMNFNLTK